MASPAKLSLVVVVVLIALATVCVAAVQLSARIPLSPWESSIAMEAVRLNAGLPIYESAHATHLYGPLLTVILAGAFQATGLNLIAARVVMSMFAIALAIFLSAILCHGKSRTWAVVAVLLFLGINLRTNLIVFSTQPDWAASFLAVIGLCVWITRKDSLLFGFVSVALFVCATLCKQTSAAFTLIPPAYVLLWKRPLRLRDLAAGLIPTVSILLTLAAIYWLWPRMFAAIVTIPASIKVYPERLLRVTLYLVVTFPIFLIALWSLFRARRRITETECWILAALIVLVPVSVWTMCKSGSGYNSLLFAYLAMTALCVARFEAVFDWLCSLSRRRGFAAAVAIALATFASFFIQVDHVFTLLSLRHGDDKYDVAVTQAGNLPGTVCSPQDPTIAYRAKNYFGRSLFAELDTHAVNGNWPSVLPDSMKQELAHCKYVVAIKSYVPAPMFDSYLPTAHFEPLPVPELEGSVYTIWKRTGME